MPMAILSNIVLMHKGPTLGLLAATGCACVTAPTSLLNIVSHLKPAIPLSELV
jgi:hypothetical protein